MNRCVHTVKSRLGDKWFIWHQNFCFSYYLYSSNYCFRQWVCSGVLSKLFILSLPLSRIAKRGWDLLKRMFEDSHNFGHQRESGLNPTQPLETWYIDVSTLVIKRDRIPFLSSLAPNRHLPIFPECLLLSLQKKASGNSQAMWLPPVQWKAAVELTAWSSSAVSESW